MVCLHSNRKLTKAVGIHIRGPEWEGPIITVPFCVALEENLHTCHKYLSGHPGYLWQMAMKNKMELVHWIFVQSCHHIYPRHLPLSPEGRWEIQLRSARNSMPEFRQQSLAGP